VKNADPVYFEKRSALPWTRMVAGLLYLTVGVVATLITFVLSLTLNHAIGIATLVAVWWDVFWLRYLRSAWPTGIWVDEAGIRGGAGHLHGPECTRKPAGPARGQRVQLGHSPDEMVGFHPPPPGAASCPGTGT
jgi:hypothetical protein